MNGGDPLPSMPRTYCSSSSLSSSFSGSSSTQFTPRGGCFCVFCCFGALRHTAEMAHDSTLVALLPFCGAHLQVLHRKIFFSASQTILLRTRHCAYRLAFYCDFVFAYDFWRRVPSSYAIANSSASFGFVFGSVHSSSWTARFFMFRMKMSRTKLSVCAPKSHSDVRPFRECQNCSNVSEAICFRERNLNLSNVRFLFVS